MKKTTRVIAAVSAVFLILSMTTLAADDTAAQNVVLSLEPDTTGVAAIRVFDGTDVSPTVTFNDTYSSSYTVGTPGAEATDGGSPNFGVLSERSGGSIQYTVRGLSNQKITVHSATPSYNADTLYVVVGGLQDASGESVTTKGTLFTSTDTDPKGTSRTNVFYIDNTNASGSAQDIITGIPGTNTYTGTTKATATPGAPISYGFISTPGVNTITVTYTITADD